ncbi:tol-pal system YbgF family protein [Acidisphaera sp. L21]|uniref:tetratricopeptide repeat protein n=1 Tax=Acidisphaera sp. L21 TaxID=1641851 RepID=UPI00131DEEE5|nr:tetratricopeptide repeat protein [Acidisphaera sp. L21]
MRVAGLVLAGALLMGGPAMAQMDSREAIALQNQILELRQQMQSMPRGGGGPAPVYRPDRGGGTDPGLTAQLLDRVSTLEDQVRTLRGQVDQLTNQQQRQSEDLAKQIADLTFAMQNGGGGGGGGSASPPPPRASQQQSPPPSSLGGGSLGSLPSGPPAGPPPRTPELAMQEGNAALARRDYPAAEAAAREVLGKKGPRAADAQFLLAQAEIGQRNYQQAAPDFYDAYNRAKTSARAPDALLGVANALIGLGDRQSACDALAKLKAEFPQPRPDVRDGVAAARQRAACR